MLSRFQAFVNGGAPPFEIGAVTARLKRERAHYETLLVESQGQKVYGGNTQPGHRDDRAAGPEADDPRDDPILQSHALPVGPPHACARAARSIGHAKLLAFANGGSGITPDLFTLLHAVVTDPTFQPRIPLSPSYSSGDVVPAAHFALAALGHARGGRPSRYRLAAGESMALVNGSFVHLGLAAHVMEALDRVESRLIRVAGTSARAAGMARTNLLAARPSGPPGFPAILEAIAATLTDSPTPGTTQLSVSFRALPQTLAAFLGTARRLEDEIAAALFSPSSNPLVDPRVPHALSQASFLAPGVALATSGMLDCLLFTAWSSVGRTNHLLSGRVEGIPEDGIDAEGRLGAIQAPKVMTAWLEDLQRLCAPRPFQSSASTSRGIEDLWTSGLALSRALDQGLALLDRILSWEESIALGRTARGYHWSPPPLGDGGENPPD
jgi:histidine ammonia-lyase